MIASRFRPFLAAVFVLAAHGATGQEVCQMVRLAKPGLTLADMYGRSEKAARAWKPDAVPVTISTTILGYLQPDGSSVAWNLNFYSKSAGKVVTINTMNGIFRCWAQAESPGRIPDLKPNFFLDGTKLYAIAKQRGGSLIAHGYSVMLGSAAAPGTRHATWYLTFSKNRRNGPLSVIVNANTGAFERAVKD